ncbi:hypothetical protein Dimus_000121 [Dionaea muscipula]
MDSRSRSKRSYYYDNQDYDSENFSRTKTRYAIANHHYPSSWHHPRSGGGGGGAGVGVGGGGARPGKVVDPSVMVTTSYRILCHDVKAGGVIGKSGSIIKSIRQHTGAWINVHELLPEDEERIIEISDTRRRDPDGRMPAFSPAQEALLLIHQRIVESDVAGAGHNYHEEDNGYGGSRGGSGGGCGPNRVVTRLVVSRMHVGSLLGKGGKIIEHMRIETKTQIRVLPRDHSLPRCVSMGEEIVQVVGDVNAVKNAIAKIAGRLRESQHRERKHFQGRFHTEDRFFEDDFIPPRRSFADGGGRGSRSLSGSNNNKGSSYSSRSSRYGYESEVGEGPNADAEASQPFYEDLVFQILCPIDKIDGVIGESSGIVDLLQNEIGVDVKVSDPVSGSDERIIMITSDEGPDDDLFPAQEALLHIQTRIVDLVPDTENVATTRLIVPSSDIGCLNEGDGSLSVLKKMTGAEIEIVPREKVPVFVSGTDELVQIVGEIKAAREALIEITARLRSYLYRDLIRRDTLLDLPKNAGASTVEVSEGDPPPHKVQTSSTGRPSKDVALSGTGSETPRPHENGRGDDTPPTLTRIAVVPLVTRSTLEVVIPDFAAPKLLAKSNSKLSQISELSGARVTLVEDDLEETQKVIRISGTREQSERAQSLLQGFILSTQEDVP